jgi:predicted nucleotidyltransferase component of viral defense system
MIDRQEVMELAREFGLAPNVIEKDYALGWLLAGISGHRELAEWVFKGGTCLKKCYFETYRFSEDLDFTLTEPEHLDERFLANRFAQVAEWIYDSTGLEVPVDTIRFEVYQNPRGKLSAQGRVGYRGPMKRAGDAPRIKLDLTDDEVLVLDPAMREVHHPYSDRPASGIFVRCYSFEEVFAEKIRALTERTRPRDLYDVIHLFRHDELRPNRELVLETLHAKCAFKEIQVPTMSTLEQTPERIELEADWASMLGHQLPALPPFQEFWDRLPEVFQWLHAATETPKRPRLELRMADVDPGWQPPPMAQAWGAAAPLEIIRFAAANRLCVDLAYQGTHRIIEPYSLRRTRDNNLLLYAARRDTGEPRSYRVDRIEGASATTTPFEPRYLVELTPAGPVAAPPVTRTQPADHSPSARRARLATRRTQSTHRRSGLRYVFKCTVCGKHFTRTSYDANLNPHKGRHGYPCLGRAGVYVKTLH